MMVHMWLSCRQHAHFTDEETGVTGWPEFSQPGSGEWQENGPEWPTLLATPGPRLATPGLTWDSAVLSLRPLHRAVGICSSDTRREGAFVLSIYKRSLVSKLAG